MRIMQRNCQCLFSGHWEQIMRRENVDVELTSFQSGTRLMQVLDCQSLGGQVQVRNTSLKSSSWFPRHSWLLETLTWWQLLAMVLSPSGKRSSFDAAVKRNNLKPVRNDDSEMIMMMIQKTTLGELAPSLQRLVSSGLLFGGQ